MLPIRKVVLYKHGVGYFERQGEVTGDASIDLHFRASEMNDVLKSLTTLDLGEGHVASISYESTKPADKQLEDITLRLPDSSSLTGLLAQVKGARVRVEVGPRQVEGTVTGIEQAEKPIGETRVKASFLALLVGGESIQIFDLLEIKSLTLLDEGLRKDLQHLLDILISAKKKDLKRLTIFGKGQGARQLVASYTLETPVWKTSYRVLLAAGKTLVQGWALVDNTQDEDWENVSLTLVAGLPISFVHDLYSPRYKRRPVVEVREEEAYGPPVLEEALTLGLEEDEMVAAAAVGPVLRGGAAPARKMVDRARARERSVKVETRTVEVGDLFQYEIRNPVTVKRNQSALVPILQGDFEGRRVAVYNPEIREKNPMSAVLFRNTTGMTLEGGPLTVIEDESYVGESMLDTLKPGEERLVPFSVELGCKVALDHKSDLKQVHLVRIQGGNLHLHRYRIQKRIYRLDNRTGRPLDLYLEHRFQKGWQLVEPEKPPVETTESFYRFRLEAPPGASTFTVGERGDEAESYSVQSVSRDRLQVWLESRYIDAETLAVLQELGEINERVGALERQIKEREGEIDEIFKNQERLRKNLQSLGTSQDEKGLRERYVADLAAEEDKLRDLREEIKETRTEKDRLAADLRGRIGRLKLEVRL